jgi:hypothetical protein
MRLSRLAMLAVVLIAGCGKQSSPPNPISTIGGNVMNVGSQIPEMVRTALEEGQDFELYSLDPKHRDEEKPSEFLRRKVIGKTLVKDAATRKAILAAFENADVDDLYISCFDPRHAIRVSHGGKSFYLTICFQCENVYAWVGDDDEKPLGFKTARSPEVLFDEVLKAAGVPLAAKANLEDRLERRPAQ